MRDPSLDLARDLDHLELLAGKMAVTCSMVEAGFRALPHELEIGQPFEILSPIGFFLALLALLKVARGGGMLAAPVCSSWGYMTRGRSCRTQGDSGSDGDHGCSC